MEKQIRFCCCKPEDYEAVCRFLIELNKTDKSHINWNWARFEWMAEHPMFDKSKFGSVGLWMDSDLVVGAAVYDMYFGEAFCAALPGYEALYPEILDYAYRELKDDSGLGIAICDDNQTEINTAIEAGFSKSDQTETIMSIELDKPLSAELPEGLRFTEMDHEKEEDGHELQWLFWQGFDHGTDREEFERQEEIEPPMRPHFNKHLSIAAETTAGEKVSYCCLWYHEGTDYAYVEPVCTIPSYRGKGAAKAVINEALNRAAKLGAKKAYVISDMAFYEKLGFTKEFHYTFYWKT